MKFALLLALAAPAPPPDPATVRDSLAGAAVPVAAMGACAQDKSRHEERYQAKFSAYVALEESAASLFGRKPELPPDLPASGCGERAFAGYEAAAEAGLAKTRLALADAAARMPGLWFGTLPLCGDDVAGALIEPLTEDGGMSQLSVTLRPGLKAPLLALTEDRVNLRISVRIDGEEVMAPNVSEPLSTGAISLSGPDDEALERVRKAALRPCR
jgi:hypothetical protein